MLARLNSAVWALFAVVLIGYTERAAISHLVAFMRPELGGDPLAIGFALSGFGWGYVVALPFSGLLIQSVGPRAALQAMILIWAGSVVALAFSANWTYVAIVRFCLGMAEAPLFPIFASYIASRYVARERSVATSIVEGGSYFGLALAGVFAVSMAATFGWRSAFLALSAAAVLAVVATPLVPKHLEFQNNATTTNYASRRHGGSALARRAAFALAAMGFLAYNLFKTFYSTWMPVYLIDQQSFSSGAAASLAFIQSLLCPGVAFAAGWISYELAKRLPVPNARAFPIAVFGGVGATVVFTSLLQGSSAAIPLTMAFWGVIAMSPIIWCFPADVAINSANIAHIAGLLNAIANVGTIASPLLVGALIAIGGEASVPGILAIVALASGTLLAGAFLLLKCR